MLTAGGLVMLSGIGNHLNPLTCIPAECNSLTVDERFAPFLGDYTEQPAKVQHLAIKYRGHPGDRHTSGRDPLETLRNMSHLTQLRSLKVETPGDMSGLAGLGNLPNSLTSLHIGGWGNDDTVVALPDPDLERSRESACLRRLRSLQFDSCYMQLPIGSSANLEGLTSLSFCYCHAGRDIDAVLKLTNLVSLDLTGVTHQEHSDAEPWSKFEAWPALHVFKFAGCWLIDDDTVLDMATVQEVHTDKLAVGMTNANVHLVLRERHSLLLETLASAMSWWSTHLVNLRIIVTLGHGGAPYLATIANTVLEALSCLQFFHLAGAVSFGHSVEYDAGHIVLRDGYSGQLKDLKLHDCFYHTLDLRTATCLTSICLKNIDQPQLPCELILPDSVVRLEVFGDSLTTRHAKCLLEVLPSLTHVKLGNGGSHFGNVCELSNSACMPTMPGSLQWLSVTSESLKKVLDGSAQDCLRFCTGLEYLILPSGQCPEAELYAWVKDARYVRISEEVPELGSWWFNAYFYF